MNDDIISRSGAVALILSGKVGDDSLVECPEECNSFLDWAAEEVGKMPSAQRWIPVTEKLPETNEYVGDVRKYYLIQNEYGDMQVAHYSTIGWVPMYSIKATGDEVVAWMPLPVPYKGEEDE